MYAGTAIQNNLIEFYHLVQWATSAAISAPLPCMNQSGDDRNGEGSTASDLVRGQKPTADGRRAVMLTHAPITSMTITTSGSSLTSTITNAAYGGLLGDLEGFKETLAAPIEAGQDPKASNSASHRLYCT